jgi:hypothetical protein
MLHYKLPLSRRQATASAVYISPKFAQIFLAKAGGLWFVCLCCPSELRSLKQCCVRLESAAAWQDHEVS